MTGGGADGRRGRRLARQPGQRAAVRGDPVGAAPGRREAPADEPEPDRRAPLAGVGQLVHPPHEGDRRHPAPDAAAAPPDADALGVLRPRRDARRAGRPAPQPDRHRPRHHAARLDRARDRRRSLAIVAVVLSRRWRAVPRVATTGRVRVAGHVRPARPHVRAPPAPVARLLHRREGGRDHDPHDERHRGAPAAAPGRARRSSRCRASRWSSSR